MAESDTGGFTSSKKISHSENVAALKKEMPPIIASAKEVAAVSSNFTIISSLFYFNSRIESCNMVELLLIKRFDILFCQYIP